MHSVHRNMHLLALGSNATAESSSNSGLVAQAMTAIKSAGVETLRSSRIFRTPAFPAGNGPDFANACVAVTTEMTAAEMLALCHRIEAEMGRVRDKRWGQRVIDIDLLATDQQVLPDRDTVTRWMDLPLDEQMRVAPGELLLPHPRLHERAFVLVPLADIAPDWVHPLTGASVRAMLEALDPALRAEVEPI